MPGPIATRILRPLCSTSAVSESGALRNTANVAGGFPNSSIDSCSSTIFSRAVTSAWASRSLRAVRRRSSLLLLSGADRAGCVTAFLLLCCAHRVPRDQYHAKYGGFSYRRWAAPLTPLTSTLNLLGRGRPWPGDADVPPRGGHLPSGGP